MLNCTVICMPAWACASGGGFQQLCTVAISSAMVLMRSRVSAHVRSAASMSPSTRIALISKRVSLISHATGGALRATLHQAEAKINRRCNSPSVSGRKSEQSYRVVAKDRGLLVIAQARRCEHVIDRVLLPGNRMVGAEHELARADLRQQVAQAFRREHHGVIVELLEILRWSLG